MEEDHNQPAADPEAPILLDDEPTTQPQNGDAPDAADTPTDEPTTPDPSNDEPADDAGNSAEDDLNDWAAKKGIDLSTPEGQAKALKSMREAERTMHRKSQEASELSKQLTSQPVEVDSDNELVQQLANEVVQMKRTQTVEQFKAQANITQAQEDAMVTYLNDNPAKVALVNNGLMTLQEVYQLSGAGTQDPEEVKKAGGQEALQKLANKQRATAPKGAATTQASPEKDDPFLVGFNKA